MSIPGIGPEQRILMNHRSPRYGILFLKEGSRNRIGTQATETEVARGAECEQTRLARRQIANSEPKNIGRRVLGASLARRGMTAPNQCGSEMVGARFLG